MWGLRKAWIPASLSFSCRQGVLQCVAVLCSAALQCVAELCCIVLQCRPLLSSKLHFLLHPPSLSARVLYDFTEFTDLTDLADFFFISKK